MCLQSIKDFICHDKPYIQLRQDYTKCKNTITDLLDKHAELTTEYTQLNEKLKTCETTYAQTLARLEDCGENYIKYQDTIKELQDQLSLVPPELIIPPQVAYWDTKYPNANIYYSGRTLPLQTTGRYSEDVRHFLTPHDGRIIAWAQNRGLTIEDPWHCNNIITKIYKEDRKGLHYMRDKDQFGISEYWLYPSELRELKHADCEDFSFQLASRLLAAGFPSERLRVVAGATNNGDGGHCCIERTQITTKKGFKPIEKVEKGDLILTRDGWKSVEEKWERQKEKDEKIFEIYPAGIPNPLIVTGDHKILVKELSRTYPASYSIKRDSLMVPQERNSSRYTFFGFKRTDKIQKKDVIFLPIPQEEMETDLTPGKAWLLGMYIGDGNINLSYSKNGNIKSAKLRFSINANDTKVKDDIFQLLKQEFNINPDRINVYHVKNSGCLVLTLFDTKIAKWFSGMGGYPNKKTLSPPLLFAKKDIQREIVKGWARADGHLDEKQLKNNKLVITTAYDNLAEQLCFLLRRLRLSYFINKNDNIRGFGKQGSYIYAVGIPNANWELKQETNKNTVIKYYKNFAVTRVRKINEIKYLGSLFDLTVTDSPEYTANGILIHNCTIYVLGDDFNSWYHLDSTGAYKESDLCKYPTSKDSTDSHGVIGENIWFAFHDKKSFAKFRTNAARRTFKKDKAMIWITIKPVK